MFYLYLLNKLFSNLGAHCYLRKLKKKKKLSISVSHPQRSKCIKGQSLQLLQNLGHFNDSPLRLPCLGSFEKLLMPRSHCPRDLRWGLGIIYMCVYTHTHTHTHIFFRTTPKTYGSSWARGQIRAAAEAYATAVSDLSHICDLHHSLQQHWIPNLLSEARY